MAEADLVAEPNEPVRPVAAVLRLLARPEAPVSRLLAALPTAEVTALACDSRSDSTDDAAAASVMPDVTLLM